LVADAGASSEALDSEADRQHPIFGPLAEDQKALLDAIAEPWRTSGRWPVLDYVSRVLSARTGGDVFDVASRMPVVQSSPQNRYQLIFFERGPSQSPDQQIGLTIAGLRQLGAREADVVARVIGYLADADANLEPDPTKPVNLVIPIRDLMSTHLRRELRGWRPAHLAHALSREPALFGVVQEGDAGSVSPSSDRIRPFRGVVDAASYLLRLIQWFGARVELRPASVEGSPLSLSESLGYLDAVWRVRVCEPLLGRAQPASYGRLVLDAASTDEFDARLSALADVLSHLTVQLPPEKEAAAANEPSLRRLLRRLALELTGPS
jgi:hypothetical protein